VLARTHPVCALEPDRIKQPIAFWLPCGAWKIIE
jgi:hypothetical protein